MLMEVQGRLMQACFIEIQQVFAKKIRADTFLTEWNIIVTIAWSMVCYLMQEECSPNLPPHLGLPTTTLIDTGLQILRNPC